MCARAASVCCAKKACAAGPTLSRKMQPSDHLRKGLKTTLILHFILFTRPDSA